MKPLSSGFDHDPLVLIKVSNASFWLEEGVFLPGGGKGFFEHNIGVSHRPGCIAFAEGKMQKLVGAQVCVDQWRIRGQGHRRISDCRKIFICNGYQMSALQSSLSGFSDDQSHFVSCKTDHILTQDRLVSVNETKG